MLPEGVSFRAYKNRIIAEVYVGQSEPVYILAPEGTTSKQLLEGNKNLLMLLNVLVEDVKKAARVNNSIGFEIYKGHLQMWGDDHNLGGIDNLIAKLKNYYERLNDPEKKDRSLIEFYQHAL